MAEKHDKDEHSGGGHGGGGHGPGGGGHEEAHEGAPEWLISFADNVALMMGFFVILVAMNMAKETAGGIGGNEKNKGGDPDAINAPQDTSTEELMLDFAIGLREAFNNPVDLSSKDPKDEQLRQRLLQRAGKSETKVPGVKGYEQDVQGPRPSEYRAVTGTVPFAENSAGVSNAGLSVLNEVSQKIRGRTLMVEVRGHTSAAEAFNKPDAAMKLSWDRAQAVAKGLAERGVDWWQLRLVVCGDHDRLQQFPNSKADDRANSRVEVVITDEVVPDKVPMQTAGE